jgi:hypothetical protein
VRPGLPAFRLLREEDYQAIRLQLNDMRHQFREVNQLKHQQFEAMKKEVVSATPPPQRHSGTAGRLRLRTGVSSRVSAELHPLALPIIE